MAVIQRCVTVHKLVVQDGSAGIGRASESTNLLPIDGEGDVGSRDGIAGDCVRKYVEDVHCGSGELYGYRYRGLRMEIRVVMPGLAVDLAEV